MQYYSFAAQGFRIEYQALGFSTDCHVFVGERVPDTPTSPTQRGNVTL